MRKIRVLIVDDSVVVRRIVANALSTDPDLEIAGLAANGSIALQKITQVNPDIVTLDVSMPVMDGLETLREIRRKYPSLPVIMLSAVTEKAASVTLDALALGANDYVTKPSNAGSISEATRRISDELIPKIKIFCAKISLPKPQTFSTAEKLKTPKLKPKRQVFWNPDQRTDIVAIGVSVGGPNALAELIPNFPADFPVPIVIVQHMPVHFTKLLAARLNAISNLEIMECVSGQLVKPGEVLLAPGNYHMALKKEMNVVKAVTNQSPHILSCRPSVDTLFNSAASIYGANMLAVILTGMGQDGLVGCGSIYHAGGSVIVQDEESSVVWGMPGLVAKANLADKILPLNKIGPEIIEMVQVGRQPVFPA